MFGNEIDTLLHKSLGSLPAIVREGSLRRDVDDLLAMALPGMKLAVIDDSDTSQALGKWVFGAVRGRPGCIHVTLEGTPLADESAAADLRRRTKSCDALVAVGGGTISDLCKYASHLDGKPYAVFPTAASMNGYLSANASITMEGYKKTVAAHMPVAAFCDLSVIAAAPARLSKSGLGDCLARPTAQADWLLSHMLLDTPYDETPFALLASLEPELFERARGIARNDTASVTLLMDTLLLSGLGMAIAKGSYPASQGEHMIAHAYEMMAKHDPKLAPVRTFHGEEIGVTALIMAHRQEKLLRHRPRLSMPPFPADKIASLFGGKVADEAAKAYQAKLAVVEEAQHSDGYSEKWEKAVERILPLTLPPAKIQAVLEAAEAPIRPETLGWSPVFFPKASVYARFLRDRFTFLDFGVPPV